MGDRIAKQFNDAHTNATRESKDVEGIDHVKWARVDYQTEVELCTRWLVLKYVYLCSSDLKLMRPVDHRTLSSRATKGKNCVSLDRASSGRTASNYSV